MKYEYENAINSEIIKSFEISNNKIHINYLDESNYDIPYSIDNERYLLEVMLEQAEERNDSNTLKILQSKRNIYASKTLLFGLITYLNYYAANNYNNDINILNSTLITLLCIITVANGLGYGCANEEIKDIKKYKLYLSMIKKLEKYNNSNAFPTINDIDNYTLKDLKKLKKTL